ATALAGARKPKAATLQLRRGEVLGIAGLIGAGRTELLRALFGLQPVRGGRVRFAAYSGHASPHRRWTQGMGMISEDRKAEGLARPVGGVNEHQIMIEATGTIGATPAAAATGGGATP